MLFPPFSHISTHTCAHMQHCTYSQFLMPGLVDCHTNTEQIVNAGANYDKSFLEWVIQDYFPTDLQFRMDPAYARNASSLIVVCICFPKETTISVFLHSSFSLPYFYYCSITLHSYITIYGRGNRLLSSVANFDKGNNHVHINDCDGGVLTLITAKWLSN